MDEKTLSKSVSKKLTKEQAITVMAVGGLMLLLAIVIPTEQQSTAHTIKVVVGIIGIGVLCVGGWLRPMKASKENK